MSNTKFDISVSSISLYDISKEKIVYDTNSFPTYLLDSSLKDSFLKQYIQSVFINWLKYTVDTKPVDLDFVYEISQDRKIHIENIRNGPHYNLLKVKNTHDLENYIVKLQQERILYYYNKDLKNKEEVLHIFNQFTVYNNNLYMPENIFLDYVEKDKGMYYPAVDYAEDEKKYTIYIGYLMKKVKSLNLS